jgi:diguanylate cyclase (GGDEF)-like protein
MEAALGIFASLLQPSRRRPWANAQSIVLGGTAVLIGLLLATELEVIDRLRAGDAAYVLARGFEVVALAGLLGLGFAAVIACRDNDRMRERERRLRAEAANEARRSRAVLDPLTDLPNGQALADTLTDAIAQSPEVPLVIYLLDIDGFRSVNIAYGSSIGDAILRIVALRLRTVMRRGDLIARVEDDSFAVLVRDVASRQEAVDIGQRYVSSLDDPIILDNREYTVGVTVGLALYPADGKTPEALMERAAFDLRSEMARRRDELAYVVALTSAPAV